MEIVNLTKDKNKQRIWYGYLSQYADYIKICARPPLIYIDITNHTSVYQIISFNENLPLKTIKVELYNGPLYNS